MLVKGGTGVELGPGHQQLQCRMLCIIVWPTCILLRASMALLPLLHDDVIKWKHFPRNWPFVRGIHVPGEFPTQRPVTRSFDVFFDLRLNKRLSKQSWDWWFETLSRPLWRHCNDFPKDLALFSFTGVSALVTNWRFEDCIGWIKIFWEELYLHIFPDFLLPCVSKYSIIRLFVIYKFA